MIRNSGALYVVVAIWSLLAAVIATPATGSAQATMAATRVVLDSSAHRERFIHVNGARLELLEWGGKGPLMIFLPGFGNSAHVFDDLAPAFTDHFRVTGLTLRGVPPSSAPDEGYTIGQLAEDVRTIPPASD